MESINIKILPPVELKPVALAKLQSFSRPIKTQVGIPRTKRITSMNKKYFFQKKKKKDVSSSQKHYATYALVFVLLLTELHIEIHNKYTHIKI